MWFNGKLVDGEDTNVHVFAHAINYGTGVFERIRVYHTPERIAIFRLRDHVQRMMDGCKMMDFDLEFNGRTYGFDDICQVIKDVVRANGNAVDYVKPCIFLSGKEVGFNPVGVPVSMAITCIYMGDHLGPEYAAGAKLITSSWHKPDNLCGPVEAKVNGSYVASALAKREAVCQDANEAVMLNLSGHVAKCTGENLFLYRHGKIIIPNTVESILEGITGCSIIRGAMYMGYQVEGVEVSRIMLMSAHEVWMTGTVAEIAPVISVDGRSISDGKIGEVAASIHAKFHDIVTGRDPKYEA